MRGYFYVGKPCIPYTFLPPGQRDVEVLAASLAGGYMFEGGSPKYLHTGLLNSKLRKHATKVTANPMLATAETRIMITREKLNY